MSIVLFASFFLFLALGVPIAFVLIISTVAYALSIGEVSWFLIPQRIIYGVNSFTMLCLPFFVLAGNIMNQGGITQRLVNFAQAFVGHIRGGLAMVDVLVCMMFGTVSGSAVAGTAAVGSLMIPSMKKEGYDAPFTAGLTAAASTCCPVIPPSLAFVIYGAAAKVSVGDMFIAGVVPGIMMGLFMMIVVYFFAVKRNYRKMERVPMKDRLKATFSALPCLGLPAVVIGGIICGWFTPTEAAAAAVVYALVLSGLVYRTINLKGLWKALVDSAIDSGTVMLIVGGCYLFGWVISNERLTVHLTEALVAMPVSLVVKLILINMALLVVGMFMDSAPAIMLVAPILAPAMVSLGMDPVQVGMIICINLVIGLGTPPVGVCLYSATNIAKCSFGETIKSSLPFTCACMLALLLITYVPFVTRIPFILLGK
ncbi:TRAP transporter, DctM subunit [Desulfotomaculum arcticum]|uniref:TRAP transporter, DctM subunit n=1 Tax=Desulfotruncus arcticus DSM 17038 TaxID=1121424 RepID=A0A1I2RWB6_9FIRM|nr:TRAP transporter large permease [Desulfotruncus arcticus]SFG44858.1 TRAP transporter, DctM subunit [Desulfotomaculum arcticum] [Desulfotruncus arcticus DSM 17038]